MNTFQYILEQHGDDLEKKYYDLFIRDEFPSYESFWKKFVVPLTNRPVDVCLKNNAELTKIGKSEADICIAQLNYSILRHLIRCFDIKNGLNNAFVFDQFDLLLEGMTRLVGAQDNTFELLERMRNPSNYNPFLEQDGENARRVWKNSQGQPLQVLRSYRNHLVHGRLSPSITDGKRLCLPAIGEESLYLDWRKTTDFDNPNREQYKKDFLHVSDILEPAWSQTVSYIDTEWKKII